MFLCKFILDLKPKLFRLLQGFCNVDEEDRLSALPDAILVEILSLLPIKSAVATSVLSRRWTNLWTFITAFRFDSSSVSKPIEEHVSIIKHMFCRLQVVPINTFKLRLHGLPDHATDPKVCADISFYVDSWILQRCSRKAQHIEIRIPRCFGHFRTESHVLSRLLQTESLVSLVLRKVELVSFTLPEVISLPNLKILHVSKICNPSHYLLFINLINESSCPRLEDLYLSGHVTGHNQIVMSFRNLKKLHIGLYSTSMDPSKPTKVNIDTPNLEFFGATVSSGLVSLKFAKEPISVLREANLRCCSMDVLQAICSVMTLKLNYHVTDALNRLNDNSQLPTFSNLTDLVCSMSSPACWKALLALLHRAAKLMALTIKIREKSRRENRISWVPIDYSTPPCSLQHVKTITIYLRGRYVENEMELMKYLLCNATALEVLTVKLPISESEGNDFQRQKELELLENLSKLHTSSSSCHFTVCGYQL